MSMTTKARIIKIGNSQGIRIPKSMLEQTGLGEEVEIEVQHNQLVVRAARQPRQGWDEQFSLMAQHGDDQLLDVDTLHPNQANRWDATEWEWQ